VVAPLVTRSHTETEAHSPIGLDVS